MLNERVRLSISTSMKIGLGLATIILAIIVLFSDHIVMAFTEDAELIAESSDVMIQVFLATPLAAIQMIGAAYFQAIGKAMPALLLTLTRQGFFLIPLVLLLPKHYGENGIWYSFPIADFASALITYLYLRWEIRTRLSRRSG
jgi:Na+-driven multidrug efflux pump